MQAEQESIKGSLKRTQATTNLSKKRVTASSRSRLSKGHKRQGGLAAPQISATAANNVNHKLTAFFKLKKSD